LQVLSSCAKSLQTHAAIVEAVAKTMRGDVDESDENAGKTLNKFALLVAQIKDAATVVEQLRVVSVSRPYFLFLLFLYTLLAQKDQSSHVDLKLFFTNLRI
jgi:hypothetical protein